MCIATTTTIWKFSVNNWVENVKLATVKGKKANVSSGSPSSLALHQSL